MAGSEEQEIIQSTVRGFAENELKPSASKIDSDALIPADLLQELTSIGVFGILCPEQYGGAGAAFETMMKVVGELGQASASVALTCLNHNLACSILDEFGSGGQKKLLHELALGKKLGAIAISGDLYNSVETSSAVVNGGRTINGTKQYVVNGSFADVCIIMCNSDDKIEFLMVEKSIEGFVRGKSIGLLGARGSGIAHVSFHNATVTNDGILGTKEDAPAILQLLQEGIWLGMASITLGIARASLKASVKYANQRIQFGKPIAKFEAIQEMISIITNGIHSTSSLLDRISKTKDQGNNVWSEAAAAKVVATTMATKSAKLALRIHGGYGFIRDYPVERFVRDAKAIEILGGRNSDLQMETAWKVLS